MRPNRSRNPTHSYVTRASFKPGDESQIAEAIEAKINEYIGAHYYPLDLIVEIINRATIGRALLDGFKRAIKERQKEGDVVASEVLTLVALIAAADMANVRKSVRAVVNLILFASGPVGDMFDGEDRLTVVGAASVGRWLGKDGPLLLSSEGWDEFIEPYRQHHESLFSDEDSDDDDVDG